MIINHLKSIDFILNLVGLVSSLFIIIWSLLRSDSVAYSGLGSLLLVLSINNFVKYFKEYRKQRKEESASAKLKFKGE